MYFYKVNPPHSHYEYMSLYVQYNEMTVHKLGFKNKSEKWLFLAKVPNPTHCQILFYETKQNL